MAVFITATVSALLASVTLGGLEVTVLSITAMTCIIVRAMDNALDQTCAGVHRDISVEDVPTPIVQSFKDVLPAPRTLFAAGATVHSCACRVILSGPGLSSNVQIGSSTLVTLLEVSVIVPAKYREWTVPTDSVTLAIKQLIQSPVKSVKILKSATTTWREENAELGTKPVVLMA